MELNMRKYQGSTGIQVLLLCLYLLLWRPAGYSQKIEVQVHPNYQHTTYHLGKEQGLLGNLPYNMLQDSKGFIWFVAHNLVQRYNGSRFEPFLRIPNSSKFAVKVMEDAQQRLWVLNGNDRVSAGGVVNLWLISADRKQIWDWNEIKKQQHLAFSLKDITDYHYNEHNKVILLGLKDGSLINLGENGDTIGRWPEMTPISEIETTSTGIIILSSSNRLMLLDSTSNQVTTMSMETDITRLHIDVTGRIKYNLEDRPGSLSLPDSVYQAHIRPLIGGRGADGLSGHPRKKGYLLEGRLYDQDEAEAALACENCPRLYLDHQRNVWTADYRGLSVISLQPRWFQTMLDGYAAEVRGILPLNDSLFMVHTYKGTFVLDLLGQEQQHEPGMNFFTNSIKNDGQIWSVGNKFFVYRTYWPANPLQPEKLKAGSFVAPTNTTVILLDQKGVLWLGTRDGLYQCSIGANGLPENCIEVDQHPELKEAAINFLELRDGQVWAATSNGLFELHLSQTDSITHHQALSHLDIMHFTRDSAAFWLATMGHGLIRWEYGEATYRDDFLGKKKADVLTEVPSLCAVYDDHLGHLWIPSFDGLFRLKKKDFSYQVFHEEHNIAHNEFNRHAHARLPDGRLAFGGLDGLTVVDPQRIANAELEPPVFRVELYNGTVSNSKTTKEVHLENGQMIPLTGQRDDLKFECAILDYRTPSRGTVMYRLEGVHDDWQFSEDDKIQLERLPFGRYTLRVKARSFDNVMSANEWTIPIYARRPWYLSSWFRMLVIVGMFAAGITLQYYRNQSIRRKKELLEQQIKLRTAEIKTQNELIRTQNEDLNLLNDYKDKIIAIIGHDLRSPVIGLRNIGRKIRFLTERNQLERLSAFSSELDSRLEYLTYLTDNILAWSLTQKKEGIQFSKTLIELDRVVEEQIIMAQSTAENKEQKIIFTKNSDLKFFSSAFVLGVLIRNILTNSIKYSSRGSEIFIKASNSQGVPCISVIDEGPGITDELREKLNGYSQNESKVGFKPGGTSGMGLGLWICGSLLRYLKGQWIFQDGPDGIGLEVKIWFPEVALYQED